jgi:hypothetical protein
VPRFYLCLHFLAFSVTEEELLKTVAIVTLIIAAARLIWPEFSALIRVIWKDLTAAAKALGGIFRRRSS